VSDIISKAYTEIKDIVSSKLEIWLNYSIR
jgi:hypothetical protein